jgi:hypothetical protein
VQQVDEISKDEWVSVIDWRRVDELGGEEERATEGEEGTEALVINLCRGDVHRSAANAHIMRRCVQSRYLHLHIYVYGPRSPRRPTLFPRLPLCAHSLTTIFSFFLSLLLLSSCSLPTPDPLPRPSPIHRKSRRSHATGRVLIHIITSFE